MPARRSAIIAVPLDNTEVAQDHSAGVILESKFSIPDAQRGLSLEKKQRKPIQHSWPGALDSVRRHLDGVRVANIPLRDVETRYRAFFEGATVGMFQMNSAGRLFDLNSTMARILGYQSAEQALDDAAKGVVPTLFRPELLDKEEMAGEGNSSQCSADLQISCLNGDKKWVRFNVRKVQGEGRLVRFEGTAEDITSRKLAGIRTELLAYYDLLTGLPNRTLFQELLAANLAAARECGGRIALLLLELESFKVINDSLGEEFGDRLLQEIAGRIRTGTGEDCAMARVGGAEFAIIFPAVDDVCHLETVAERSGGRLNADYSFLGHSLRVFCNVGISIFPENGTDCETSDEEVGCCHVRGA